MGDPVPRELAEGGRRLWSALLAQDQALTDITSPLREVALEACRAKDRCDVLDVIRRAEPPLLDTPKGQSVAHPAWVEARQQANVLKQLLASLRLPDERTGKRPQRHPGPAGVRTPGTPVRVSSLERARARAAGEG